MPKEKERERKKETERKKEREKEGIVGEGGDKWMERKIKIRVQTNDTEKG